MLINMGTIALQAGYYDRRTNLREKRWNQHGDFRDKYEFAKIAHLIHGDYQMISIDMISLEVRVPRKWSDFDLIFV